MDKQQFNTLLDKYIQGNATEAEKRLLEAYYTQLSLQDAAQFHDLEEELLRKQLLDNIMASIQQQAVPAVRRRTISFVRMAAAAAVLILIAGATFLIFFNKPRSAANQPNVLARHTDNAHPPGGNKALLTLANGSTIALDSTGNGKIALQGNSMVTKSGGHLFYTGGGNASPETAYNTLSTPRGGQYQLTLIDGTRVWLNASSSIRFPAAFDKKERNVEISGEAYFEVAKDASRPFHVKVKDMTVEVLGTHFNIMAYDDENSINTTLLEGSVKISGNNKSGLLKPGQQSSFDKASETISIAEANIEKAVAWKNGMFIFKRDDIKTIMRQIGRWYNMEISYSPGMPSILYSGTISRYVDASEVLNILALGGIRFKTEGNKITLY